MAISPGSSTPNQTKAQENEKYANSVVDMSIETLVESMSLPEAFIIDTLAHMGTDVLNAHITTAAFSMRLNKNIYTDEMEDYIFGSEALQEYVADTRREGSRQSAERVRLLRSARAIMYLHQAGAVVNVDCPPELIKNDPHQERPSSRTRTRFSKSTEKSSVK